MEWVLYITIGIVAGFLAGLLGIGGGIILVPFLSCLFVCINKFPLNLATHLALGTAIAIMLVNTLMTVHAHLRANSIDWEIVKRFLPGLLVGGALGPMIAGLLSGMMLSIMVGLVVLLVALRILLVSVDQCAWNLPQGKHMFAVSFGIGTVSSLIGSGGSTFSIPFLSRCRLPMRQAIGVSVFCTLPLVTVASVSFVITGWDAGTPTGATGYIYWPAFFMVLSGSLLFTVVGAKIGYHLSNNVLRKLLAFVLFVVAIKMLVGCWC